MSGAGSTCAVISLVSVMAAPASRWKKLQPYAAK